MIEVCTEKRFENKAENYADMTLDLDVEVANKNRLKMNRGKKEWLQGKGSLVTVTFGMYCEGTTYVEVKGETEKQRKSK